MNERQQRIQGLLRLLVDRSRFRMLCALTERAMHVSELARRVGLSQSCATRHVQALATAGAVTCRRDGKRVIVRVRADEDLVRMLLAWIGGDAFETTSPSASIAARPRRRPANAGSKEVPPALAPDSGTPPPASSGTLEPLPPARSSALEDFLL